MLQSSVASTPESSPTTSEPPASWLRPSPTASWDARASPALWGSPSQTAHHRNSLGVVLTEGHERPRARQPRAPDANGPVLRVLAASPMERWCLLAVGGRLRDICVGRAALSLASFSPSPRTQGSHALQEAVSDARRRRRSHSHQLWLRNARNYLWHFESEAPAIHRGPEWGPPGWWRRCSGLVRVRLSAASLFTVA
jgi:hypothetical protein